MILEDQPLGDRQPRGLIRLGRGGKGVEPGLDLGILVLIGNSLARRIVDQDGQIRKPLPLDRKDRLREHEHRQEYERHAQSGEQQLGNARRLAFVPVQPDDQCGAAEKNEHEKPLRHERLFEAKSRSGRFAGLRRRDAHQICQFAQEPVGHVTPTSARIGRTSLEKRKALA